MENKCNKNSFGSTNVHIFLIKILKNFFKLYILPENIMNIFYYHFIPIFLKENCSSFPIVIGVGYMCTRVLYKCLSFYLGNTQSIAWEPRTLKIYKFYFRLIKHCRFEINDITLYHFITL